MQDCNPSVVGVLDQTESNCGRSTKRQEWVRPIPSVPNFFHFYRQKTLQAFSPAPSYPLPFVLGTPWSPSHLPTQPPGGSWGGCKCTPPLAKGLVWTTPGKFTPAHLSLPLHNVNNINTQIPRHKYKHKNSQIQTYNWQTVWFGWHSAT